MTLTPEELAAAQAAAAGTDGDNRPDGDGGGTQTVAVTKEEVDRLTRQLAAANREAAENRRMREKLETEKAERERAEMSEAERIKAELAAAREEAAKERAASREMLIRSAFVAEAAKAGALHPGDVYLLADKAAISVDDDGNVVGVPDAVKALIDAGRLPLSGRTPAPDLDAGAGGTKPNSGGVKLTPDEIEAARKMRLTPEKYAENKVAMAQSAQQ